jgi:hypothetical protein
MSREERIQLFKDKYEKKFDKLLAQDNRKEASKLFREYQDEVRSNSKC